jgi:hypothetical protein
MVALFNFQVVFTKYNHKTAEVPAFPQSKKSVFLLKPWSGHNRLASAAVKLRESILGKPSTYNHQQA